MRASEPLRSSSSSSPTVMGCTAQRPPAHLGVQRVGGGGKAKGKLPKALPSVNDGIFPLLVIN